jgi:hypothetical protein
MSSHQAGHDLRCERSATSPKRCRCECDGRQHGVLAARQRLGLLDTGTTDGREVETTELPHD